MNIPFAIEAIHLKRRGVDMVGRAYESATYYATPSKNIDNGGDRSLEI
ncbi:hypothetical protein [Rhizobium leguminosarum]|nr:hypothetical protein [Rhizobium leguminosarum]